MIYAIPFFSFLSDVDNVEKIENNIYTFELNKFRNAENAHGTMYVQDEYVSKIEFEYEENGEKRKFVSEIFNINNTVVDIPQTIIDNSIDVPKEQINY